jgi:hypothetical protein
MHATSVCITPNDLAFVIDAMRDRAAQQLWIKLFWIVYVSNKGEHFRLSAYTPIRECSGFCWLPAEVFIAEEASARGFKLFRSPG